MNDNYLTQAIRKLHPEAEFSYTDNDYATVKWDVLEGTAPTQAEIDAEIVKIKAQEKADKAAKAVDKAALLERIGITAEEATLLLG
jgi:hypothetical protein